VLVGHFFEPLAVSSEAARLRLPVKKLLLVLGVVGTLYAAALLIWGGSPGVLLASLSVLWSWTGLQAALLCLLNYVLRGARWRSWMAHYGLRFSWLDGLRLYLAGYAFTPTPGNVGEAVRGLMLAKNPLSTRQSLAIFGAERLADLLCLLLLCLPAVWWGLMHGALAWPGTLVFGLAGGGAIVAVLLLGAAFCYRALLLQRFSWLLEAWTCLSVRPFVWFGLTLVAWAAQGTAVWLLCRALEVHLQLLTAIGFYAVAMVAGALSALPAGLGGTEVVLAGLLVAQSANPGEALVITVLSRLLTLWLAVAIGLAALLYSAAIAKDITLS
jgi:uncharacterized membrane protein YbhN (UPF0104 family)